MALRAALSTGLAIGFGLAVGDVSAGLLATMGAFTALYASDRPYFNRAIILTGIAISLTLVVSLGLWSQHFPWLAVPLVVAIAMVATFTCNALRIGPPGAYIFALACAAGTAIPT
ncbi:MAG: hypothetical protein KGI75_25915, partial [Rhizobiaceae bacterium]|nr:hypothetical protein [Rhizobiaceae bacterium]